MEAVLLDNSEWRIINFSAGEGNRFVGDDCAVWDEKSLVVTTDHFCEGVHFDLSFMPAEAVGWRLMAANASDVISMGSRPTHFLLNAAVPRGEEEKALQILTGVKRFAEKYGISVMGGDTSGAGCFAFGVTMFGEKPEKPLLRSGARPGDKVFIASKVGLSLCGYKALKHKSDGYERSKERFLYPDPFANMPGSLNKITGAAIDISDSLLSELRLICDASKVSMEIDFDKIPVDEELLRGAEEFEIPLERLLLGSGEEFVLLFTSDSDHNDAFEIGRVTGRSSRDVSIFSKMGELSQENIRLFSHFDS